MNLCLSFTLHNLQVYGPCNEQFWPHAKLPCFWALLRFLSLIRCLLLVLFLRVLLPLLFFLLVPLFLAPFLFLLENEKSVNELTYGCKCRYSATNTRKILFRSLIRLKSKEDALSPILCQAWDRRHINPEANPWENLALGKGTEMRWRIGTPLLLKGMWSSSMPEGILAASWTKHLDHREMML